jgi:HEAT repeat protein
VGWRNQLLVVLLLGAPLVAQVTELQRIEAHLVLGDAEGALQELDAALVASPGDSALVQAQLRALALAGDSRRLLQRWQALPQKLAHEPAVLEQLGWTLLREGAASNVALMRVAALRAAATTRDVWAAPLLVEAMSDSNDQVRALAARLSLMVSTAPVREALVLLLAREKRLEVWMTAAQAVGMMRLKAAEPYLEQRIANPSTSAHERAIAIEAIVRMRDRADRQELERCLSSPRAGLRLLACGIVAAMEAREEAQLLELLLQDPSAEVRAAALTAMGLVEHRLPLDQVQRLAADTDPMVAITAGWYLLINGYAEAKPLLIQWASHPEASWRRLAAAAIARGGVAGLPLAQQLLSTNDPVVSLQLARTLLHHRTSVPAAADTIARVLDDPSRRWAVDVAAHPLFHPIVPAELVAARNQPLALDRGDAEVRLQLWRELAHVDHPEATLWVRRYLAAREPALTALALEILLEEEPEPLDAIRPLLSDPDQRVRTISALLCAYIARDPSVLPLLQASYATSPRPIQLAILEAMTLLGDPSSLPFLLGLFTDASPLTRVIAASSTLRCLNQ